MNGPLEEFEDIPAAQRGLWLIYASYLANQCFRDSTNVEPFDLAMLLFDLGISLESLEAYTLQEAQCRAGID